jgi:hypothetical protein
MLSANLEVTVDFLTEIDKLVQLLESPIFTCKYLITNFHSEGCFVKADSHLS